MRHQVKTTAIQNLMKFDTPHLLVTAAIANQLSSIAETAHQRCATEQGSENYNRNYVPFPMFIL